jgi:hypothetical protein
LPFKNIVIYYDKKCHSKLIVTHPTGPICSFVFAQQQKKYSSWRVPQIPLPPPFILGDEFEGETGFREKTRDQRQGEFTDDSIMHPLF